MPPAALPLGLVTAAICALSGAGGPVLVMPLLVALDARQYHRARQELKVCISENRNGAK